MYAIIASFQIKPERREAFHKAAVDDGRSSTRSEPGCLRFDVYSDRTDPNKFVLFEVYRDEAAFKAHTQTPHFAAFREATRDTSAAPASVVRCVNLFPPDAEWRK